MSLSDLFIDTAASCPATGSHFIPEDGFGLFQLVFLTLVYGYILASSSKMIADGSELLLLVLNPGIVGGLVLPVMGAVPDGAIVLFSGLGPIAQAQEQLSVGVGTLAGSTIMLLTVSWSMCTMLGRVDVGKNADGIQECNYRPKPKGSPKLTKGWSLFSTGTQADSGTMRAGAVIMLVTALTYFLIQGPAFAAMGEATPEEVKSQHGWAIAGFAVAMLFFVMYSIYQVMAGSDDQQRKKDATIAKAAQAGQISIQAILSDAIVRGGSAEVASASRHLEHSLSGGAGASISERDRHNLHIVIRTLFHSVRSLVKDDDFVDAQEAHIMIVSMVGPSVRKELDIGLLMEKYGIKDESGEYVLNESGFEALFTEWFLEHAKSRGLVDRSTCFSCSDVTRLACSYLSCGLTPVAPASSAPASRRTSAADAPPPLSRRKTGHFVDEMRRAAAGGAAAGLLEESELGATGVAEEEDEEDEEEDDEEEEDAGLTRGQIYLKAFGLMIVGVVVVTIFSDPMVDVLTVLGNRIGIQPFYVSFIVTPIVSNASELISSLIFAMRRSKKTITLTYSQLMGAATMNNTFVLALFLGLCAFRGLAWTFSAEVMAIFAVQVIMGIVALQRTQTTGLSLFVLALYPLSIFLVFALEQFAGWQ
ncbi:hypothetical protein FNF29_06368 [Cafeteria roenbergensis]|uniref:Sodium/calcium exchanger membrane region domain-containing protein n=1 Tax=Cafeteria roenbergensis TaxID=33653 RepID=A0A5A8C8G2_CAFRO|nr:hypothetical protein FNF29_06368 [Cafeteria roenbergensis]|eukprot:KAA0148894.1 hypothetical protein FNF29_06368 [Cafeteria roenbergensis]